jgi:hypothetical protein
MDVNFDRCTLKTNAERLPGDIGRRTSDTLKFQVASGTGWTPFVDLDPAGGDETYNCIMVSNTNQKVESQPTTCVD